jgi:hypothetical protein
MERVAKAYAQSLGVVIACPILAAITALVRLQRHGNFFDLFETTVVVAALAGMWIYFRRFTRNFDGIQDVDRWRRLVLPAWRIAALGAVGLMFALQVALRHLR